MDPLFQKIANLPLVLARTPEDPVQEMVDKPAFAVIGTPEDAILSIEQPGRSERRASVPSCCLATNWAPWGRDQRSL